jgi:hypothetical protein
MTSGRAGRAGTEIFQFFPQRSTAPPTFFSFSVCLALVWLSYRKNKQDNFLILIFIYLKIDDISSK